MLPFLKPLEDYIESLRGQSGFTIGGAPIFIAGLVVLFALLTSPFHSILSTSIELAFFLSPVWLPALVLWGAWRLWVIWRRSDFIAGQEYILLEIKPPRSIAKTPLAMEAVLSGIHLSPGETNWYKKYILGAVRPWWSLEIASIDGQVHFFIWTRANFRRIIESQIYAQYPGAQVVEAEDYTRTISAIPGEWSMWGCDYKHPRPDPLPIKTYVDYGLDKVQKEYEQVDPLANLIEFMGSLGKGEQMWIQLVIRVHKGEKYKGKKNAEGKTYTWKDSALEEIEKIREKAKFKTKIIDPITGEERETTGYPLQTKGQGEKINAMERNVAKLAFDVGVRSIYLAKPEKFNPTTTIAGVVGIFKQFSSEDYNSFIPTGWMTLFDDYPWEIFVNTRKNKMLKWLVEAFRRRQYFYEPFESNDYMIMSTEELATIYHIPSLAVETPTLPRITSVTGEAPSNLPT